MAGTTLGMMLANAPVVWLGEHITRLVPLTWVHRISAAVFVVLGLLVLFGGKAADMQTQPVDASTQIVSPNETGSTVSVVPEPAASKAP